MSLKQKLSPREMAAMVNPPNRTPLSKIALKYNVSRQRVHQVLQEYRKVKPELFKNIEKPTREQIKKKIEKNEALIDIAKHLNITLGQLRKLMDEYEIEKKTIKDTLTKERLFSLFVIKRKSDSEIAGLYNCSPNTVKTLRYRHRILLKNRKGEMEKC